MSKLVKRSDKIAFMNTGTEEEPVWTRMTKFTEISTSKNPTEYSRTYVDEEGETTDVTGYSEEKSYAFDQYTENPVHEKIAKITDDELTHCQKDVFVKQLTLVGVGNEVKRIAISDYKRAYSQRSKWVREGLVIADELATYDSRIHEDWERAFAFLKDDTADSTEEEKITKGRTFYRSHYSKDSNIKFRESFQPAYLEKGSIHMLSDLKRLGWHPDFEIKINEE